MRTKHTHKLVKLVIRLKVLLATQILSLVTIVQHPEQQSDLSRRNSFVTTDYPAKNTIFSKYDASILKILTNCTIHLSQIKNLDKHRIFY